MRFTIGPPSQAGFGNLANRSRIVRRLRRRYRLLGFCGRQDRERADAEPQVLEQEFVSREFSEPSQNTWLGKPKLLGPGASLNRDPNHAAIIPIGA
jgi:hypothetical protein